MPGFILHQGAVVQCTHLAPAQPINTVPNVLVNGLPIVVQTSLYGITGCPYPPTGTPTPCVDVRWLTASTRVTSFGTPVLLMDSQSNCLPNNTPLVIISTQTRVSAI